MQETSPATASFRYYESGVDRTFVLQQYTRIDCSRIDSVTAKDWRLAFYELNYDAIAMHIQASSPKIYIGPQQDRRCRFCGKSEASGEASFKLEAHGFPSLIGNRTFFTNYECDACNSEFGNGIENQLGIYLKPYRTLAAIRGHKSFPVIKNEREGWRIWRDDSGLHIHHQADKRVAELVNGGKTLAIAIPRDPYRPSDVYKAFIKMALSLMPEPEIAKFQHTIEWMKGKSKFHFAPPTVSTTFLEGVPVNAMSVLLMKKKAAIRELPYMMALILIANTQFQFMVPCFDEDEQLRNKRMRFPAYPLPPELNGEQHRIQFEEVDLSDSGIMRGDVVKYEFSFESRVETTENDIYGL